MKKFYITTAIPYVNGKPHIGHTLEYFQADAVRRYHDLIGDETLLLSGADENALKNVQAAEKVGMDVQAFLDKNSQVFKDAYEFFGVHLDVFQRGSDQKKHWPGVQKLWKLCNDKGDIYKKSYSGLYCVGCESFKTEDELVDGLCPIHQKKPELVQEENYFFKLSKYQDKLIQLIESNELSIKPENKRSEILSFIKSGLEDFSVSRSKKRAQGVGVPVPGDDEQVMYVWFDALAIYITGIGFGTDEEKFKKWWPADLHVIGKDINRFHTVYWPAMLLSAGLPVHKGVLVHSFLNVGGAKMSKSLGNVIDPYELIEQYGLEPVRYYLLSQVPTDADGDFTHERFKEVFNSNLANELGNLVVRLTTIAEKDNLTVDAPQNSDYDEVLKKDFTNYSFNIILEKIWEKIKQVNKDVNTFEPWSKTPQERETFLKDSLKKVYTVGYLLQPFIPKTAEKIMSTTSGEIKKSTPLFPRL